MKSPGEFMEILATYDLTKSYRATAEICGVSHNTVRAFIKARDEGRSNEAAHRTSTKAEPFMEQIEAWVDASRGKIRGDITHERLVALGYTGSQRTTRTVVAKIKADYRAAEARPHRTWIPEPGRWLQYDFGDGPVIDGAKTVLFCAWLDFSRFRIVFVMRNRQRPNVFSALDRAFRLIGGIPTYVLTDNEKLVTIEHVAGLPVRNPQAVAFSQHYSTVIHTCMPADPATKGGVEKTVHLAKADMVPTDANLLPTYDTFAQVEAACTAFMEKVNNRVHSATLEIPSQMLENFERSVLHRVPEEPFALALGHGRVVPPNTPMVTFEKSRYSVPYQLMGQSVWVRQNGNDEIIIVHVGAQGPTEVARHQRTRPGVPSVLDAHFPPRPAGSLEREPKGKNDADLAFLDIGEGAKLWLKEATAAGVGKIRVKMAAAVELAKLLGVTSVDHGLGGAAVHHRFTHEDLLSIIDTNRSPGYLSETRMVLDPNQILAQGTGAWAGFGTTDEPVTDEGATEISEGNDEN
ncbi:IS21 family transposase [Paeniglutamicibacter sp. Y32M11]|uniref:IS21 family transposase n=1 Tax=Paeniglutamicibacter sp. Y32M11 TaxID=2853258 RepID=UPI002101FB7A|nr:IS21 family transposase [Paeniglutamicibacter sp. Y32M11]